MNIEPQRALVKPRVRSDDGGTVPLENEILPLLYPGARGVIAILGGTGSGRTTALQHLACLLGPDVRVELVDAPKTLLLSSGMTVYTSDCAKDFKHTAIFHLASWTNDDLIEYLLAKHKDQCASVMQRVNAADGAKLLRGNPELWSVVLDEFAADPELRKFGDALLKHLRARLDDAQMNLAKTGCLAKALTSQEVIQRSLKCCKEPVLPVGLNLDDWKALSKSWRLIRHDAVQTLLARERIVDDLRNDGPCRYLVFRPMRTFVRIVGAAVKDSAPLLEKLRKLALDPDLQAVAGSILHAAGRNWAPDEKSGYNVFAKKINLNGAYLDSAQWSGMKLNHANCEHADFSNADLSGAFMNCVNADSAIFRRARMRHAEIKEFHGRSSNFSHAELFKAVLSSAILTKADLSFANFESADLTRASMLLANLSGARLWGADLSLARLVRAKMDGADFFGANLFGADLEELRLRDAKFTGAKFESANVTRCDMEFMELPGATFSGANMQGALLTGSFIPKGNFVGANLSGAALADIEWERADLRNADLTGCSFHMGSSRSGRLDSDIACEGSRTGFYTDDYFDQPFKAPKEIRKGNLRGADLRGAKLDKTDFYLVDLRGALYDAAQAEHLRRCGAILESRV